MKPSGAGQGLGPAGRLAIDRTPLLLVNPLSFRASRGLAERAIALATAHGAEVECVDGSPEATSAAVERILARRQRHVIVLAGDGTVHALIERLAERPAGSWLPDLLVLPGGRSNVTAADLLPGFDALGGLRSGLEQLRAGVWDGSIVERSVLRIDQPGLPLRHGFLFGGATVDTIIRRAHAYRAGGSGLLRTGHLSTPWFALGLAARALQGRAGLTCPRLTVRADGLGDLDGRVSLLLASTLLHRRGLLDPYAERGTGGLRVTAVAAGAPRFWRSLPRLVRGRYSAAMNRANGYLSGRCDRLEVLGLAGYVLDGEKFDVDPARPVVVSAGPALRFFSR
ncbi:diacylglycerol kinase family protein [Piscinibacter koreensis]|uniref:DAGKc domain-containing protein n=1 Tax=Piscinibacter koreensis TaxID=2742824 RepID=A0A7Y6TVS3_9BURK|nr:diacylglycerol kinase family protein [Schlegelella koreensis]NUZ05237.1 hypothetical protein [Schlegelella koreensis]